MPYALVYDIETQPPFDPHTGLLAAAIVLVGLVWTLVRHAQHKPKTTGYVIMGFGSLLALFGVGMMSWDHHRLRRALARGEGKQVEGEVRSWGVERQRTGKPGKHEYRTYERFYVGDQVWFGYFWEVEQAGFHNQVEPRLALRDGLRVRATYLYADGDDQPPRIVRLEVERPAQVPGARQ